MAPSLLAWRRLPPRYSANFAILLTNDIEVSMEKRLRVLSAFEDTTSGAQLFQIHEKDPMYKIDRIVYREKSREGWFREITPEDYLQRVKSFKKILS